MEVFVKARRDKGNAERLGTSGSCALNINQTSPTLVRPPKNTSTPESHILYHIRNQKNYLNDLRIRTPDFSEPVSHTHPHPRFVSPCVPHLRLVGLGRCRVANRALLLQEGETRGFLQRGLRRLQSLPRRTGRTTTGHRGGQRPSWERLGASEPPRR